MSECGHPQLQSFSSKISFDQRLKNGNIGNDHRPASPKRSMAFLRLSLVDQAINKRTQAASSRSLPARPVGRTASDFNGDLLHHLDPVLQSCNMLQLFMASRLLASESPASSTLLEGKEKMLDMTEEMMKT